MENNEKELRAVLREHEELTSPFINKSTALALGGVIGLAIGGLCGANPAIGGLVGMPAGYVIAVLLDLPLYRRLRARAEQDQRKGEITMHPANKALERTRAEIRELAKEYLLEGGRMIRRADLPYLNPPKPKLSLVPAPPKEGRVRRFLRWLFGQKEK
ncbi:MAG: hypothetical protein Q7R83_00615 [bacterium]|nr:hypothetical protein [bacterium]